MKKGVMFPAWTAFAAAVVLSITTPGQSTESLTYLSLPRTRSAASLNAITMQGAKTTTVSTEAELVESVQPFSTIIITSDILLYSEIIIHNCPGLIVKGNGHFISGQGIVRCFTITGNITSVELYDVAIDYGNASDVSGGGALLIRECSLTMVKCNFTHNFAAVGSLPLGGGIASYDGKLTFESCFFFENKAGAIFTVDSYTLIKRSHFVSNDGTYGGGLFALGGLASVENSTFISNSGEYGGGCAFIDVSHVTLVGCTFVDNSATSYGGGVFVDVGSISMKNCMFARNKAASCGGGLYVDTSAISFGDSFGSDPGTAFTNNTANLDGGGLFSTALISNISIFEKLLFEQNIAGRNGGGMYSINAVIQQLGITSLIFRENVAKTGSGGGMHYSFNDGVYESAFVLFLSNAAFTENWCYEYGGGLQLTLPLGVPVRTMLNCSICGRNALDQSIDCLFVPVNSTWREWVSPTAVSLNGVSFVENRAHGIGGSGGALAATNGDIEISNSTFERNSASKLGGAIFLPRAQFPEATTSLRLSGVIIKNDFVSFGKGNEIFSESASQIVFDSGTKVLVGTSSTRSAGSSDVEIESGGKVIWRDQSGIFCPPGYQLNEPSLVEPFPITPLPNWNNSACQSERGPCSTFALSCFPPMLIQSIAYSCTPCASGSYSLDFGSFVDGTPKEIVCIGSCPYGGDCSRGGADLRARPGFYGAVALNDALAQKDVKFVPCPDGFCCEDGNNLCNWDDTCIGGRVGKLCGRCGAGKSISLFNSNCVPTESCVWYSSLLTLELVKSTSFALLFYFFPTLGFASPFALVVFYDQFFCMVSTTRQDLISSRVSFFMASSSSWTEHSAGWDNRLCAWHGMQPLLREFSPFFDVLALIVIITLIWLLGSLKSVYSKVPPITSVDNDQRLFHTSSRSQDSRLYELRETFILKGSLLHEKRAAAAAAQALNFSFGSVITAAAALLTCTSDLPNSGYRLIVDAEVSCFVWWQGILLVIIGALFVASSTPIIVYGAEYMERPHHCICRCLKALTNAIMRDKVTSSVAELAMARFREDSWYWLSVMILQRFLLASCRALDVISPTSRALLAVCICVVFLMLHTSIQPFKRQSFNHAQTLLLTCVTLVAVINIVPSDLATNALSTSLTMDHEVNILITFEACLLYFPMAVIFFWQCYDSRVDVSQTFIWVSTLSLSTIGRS